MFISELDNNSNVTINDTQVDWNNVSCCSEEIEDNLILNEIPNDVQTHEKWKMENRLFFSSEMQCSYKNSRNHKQRCRLFQV